MGGLPAPPHPFILQNCVQSNLAISNTQGKQELIRYSRGSLYLEHLLGQIKSKRNEKLFDIVEVPHILCSISASSTLQFSKVRGMGLTLNGNQELAKLNFSCLDIRPSHALIFALVVISMTYHFIKPCK